MLAGLILVSMLLSVAQGCKEKPKPLKPYKPHKPHKPKPTLPPPRPPPPPPPPVVRIRALLVVGGTGKNNMSVSTVEMLPLDDPINSGCKSVASLPNKLDRAVGANFFPFYPISQSRCECFVPPWYHGKGPWKYPHYFSLKYPDKVNKQNKDKCCCKGEHGIPHETRVDGEAAYGDGSANFSPWQAKKGVKWCHGPQKGPLVCGGRMTKDGIQYQSRTCFQYNKQNGQWDDRNSRLGVPTLNQPRELSAGMMHVPLGFMVTGGIEDLQTGEITQNGAKMVTNTRLPIGIDRHCMAGNNAHWLMLRGYNTGATDFVIAVGGYSNEVLGGYSNRAYIMRCEVGALGSENCGNLVWVRMANMKVPREGPMCGVVRARDNNSGGGGQMAYKMVVAGGLNKNGYTDAVEIYDMRRNTWTMGNPLPFGPLAFAASVPYPDSAMVEIEQIRNQDMTFYIVGGESNYASSQKLNNNGNSHDKNHGTAITNEIWKYNPHGDSWQKQRSHLSQPRTAVTAMVVYQNQFKGC